MRASKCSGVNVDNGCNVFCTIYLIYVNNNNINKKMYMLK